MQTRLRELSKFQPIGSLQEEIVRKHCRFQIRDEGARLSSATQNAIGNALAGLLDTTLRDRDDASKLTSKEVFALCRGKFCSINGAPICRLVDENLRKEPAMLAQAETKTKEPFANSNGKPDKSDCSDTQVAKIEKELTLTQTEIAKLKNQLHQAKENMAKERAELSSKSKNEDSQEDEVGTREQESQSIVTVTS